MPDQNDIVYSFDIFRIVGALFSEPSTSGNAVVAAQTLFERLLTMAIDIWQFLMFLGIFISLLCIFGIIYVYVRAGQLAEIENEGLREAELLYDELYRKGETKNRRWHDVEQHIASDSPNDWKLAIIEADIMLEELLEVAGYAGLSVGDKLKSASPAAFKSINQAWRAHQVRNQIAHEGSDFVLTKKMAQETISQYRMVFQEFDFI